MQVFIHFQTVYLAFNPIPQEQKNESVLRVQMHPEDGGRLNGEIYLRTQQLQSHARGASTMSELITAVMFVRDANSIMALSSVYPFNCSAADH